MDRKEYLNRITLMYQAVESLPEEIEPMSLWIDGDRYDSSPLVTVYESFNTRPTAFSAYAALVQSPVVRVSHSEENDALVIKLHSGVRLKLLVDKEEE